jgi:hypothetical protein
MLSSCLIASALQDVEITKATLIEKLSDFFLRYAAMADEDSS